MRSRTRIWSDLYIFLDSDQDPGRKKRPYINFSGEKMGESVLLILWT
jgi:hypothetical protein